MCFSCLLVTHSNSCSSLAVKQGHDSKALAIHKPRFTIPRKPSSDIIKPLGTLEREALPKNRLIGDMGRLHPSLIPPMRGADADGRRFLSPRDFKRIMQSKDESSREVAGEGCAARAMFWL